MNEAPQPVQQMDTEIRNPFPVASAQPNFSQLCSDSKSPIEDMKLPYNEKVLTVTHIRWPKTSMVLVRRERANRTLKTTFWQEVSPFGELFVSSIAISHVLLELVIPFM